MAGNSEVEIVKHLNIDKNLIFNYLCVMELNLNSSKYVIQSSIVYHLDIYVEKQKQNAR